MRKPNTTFYVWLFLSNILYFCVEYFIGAVVFHYVGLWLGLSLTTNRIVATIWFIWAFVRSTGRYSRRKEAVMWRLNATDELDSELDPVAASKPLPQNKNLRELAIVKAMEGTGQTREEVEEDLRKYGL
jgi:hypothetical protein